MSYRIIISKSVQKQLDTLPGDMSDRIAGKLKQLAEEPRPSGVVKLKGADNEYRIRAGDYRIRYEIDDQDKTIRLLQCKHRRDVYRQ
ncbi:MAG: type II toxin-antitoxin system RelE/ParE family toxin [Elainellaceae cyanobacterium]